MDAAGSEGAKAPSSAPQAALCAGIFNSRSRRHRRMVIQTKDHTAAGFASRNPANRISWVGGEENRQLRAERRQVLRLRVTQTCLKTRFSAHNSRAGSAPRIPRKSSQWSALAGLGVLFVGGGSVRHAGVGQIGSRGVPVRINGLFGSVILTTLRSQIERSVVTLLAHLPQVSSGTLGNSGAPRGNGLQ
jgi:hypothetical protein